jgi:hypothetical protein
MKRKPCRSEPRKHPFRAPAASSACRRRFAAQSTFLNVFFSPSSCDAHDLLAKLDNGDLSDHRREGTRVQHRRNVQLGSRDNLQKPRTGKDGFWHHTRLGLVGWISYWCCGDAALAVVMLVALIKALGLTELVSNALGSRQQKEAETNAKIVDLLKHALDETKNCRTEQQRVEFHIALALDCTNLRASWIETRQAISKEWW